MDHVAQTVTRSAPTPSRWPSIPPKVALISFRALDFLAIAGIGFGIFVVYLGAIKGDFDSWPRYLLVAALGAALTSNVIGGSTWRFDRDVVQQLAAFRPALLTWCGVAAGLLAAAFILKISISFSRVWALSWFAGTVGYIVASRLLLKELVTRWIAEGRLGENCVIVGDEALCAHLLGHFEPLRKRGLRVSGVLALEREDGESATLAPKQLERLVEAIREGRIGRVILALPWAATDTINLILRQLRSLPVEIQFYPDMRGVPISTGQFETVGDVSLLKIRPKPLSDLSRTLKRAEDIALSALCLTLFAPLMLLIGAAIKLDSRGPVIFRQNRYGLVGNLIEVYKFRTLHAEHADAHADRLITRQDPRVTRVGRFLRRLSLDELPQLFNVLRGEMSLVGPRPHALHAKAEGKLYHEVVSDYFMRYRVKPGITGWAQVNGWRGETDTVDKIRQRVECDLYYIDNWSVMLDLRILVMTVVSLMGRANAY